MEPQTLKTASQVIIFIGTAVVLLGSIGLWYFNDRVEDRKNELIEQRTRERDAAINQIQRTSILIAELDNPIDRVLLRVFFRKNYMPSDLKGFRVFISFSALGAYYDLSIGQAVAVSPDGKEASAFEFRTLAGPPDRFKERPYKMSEVGPSSPLSWFSWDLLWVLHEKPKLKLRDLHRCAITLAAAKEYHPEIDHFDIVANSWIITSIPVNAPRNSSQGNPVVDVKDKTGFFTYQFNSAGGYKVDMLLIDLFGGGPKKL